MRVNDFAIRASKTVNADLYVPMLQVRGLENLLLGLDSVAKNLNWEKYQYP